MRVPVEPESRIEDMRYLGLLFFLVTSGLAHSPAQGVQQDMPKDHMAGVPLERSGSQPRLGFTVLEIRILGFLMKIGMSEDFSFKFLIVLGKDKEAMRQLKTFMDDIDNEPEDTPAHDEKISRLKEFIANYANKS